MVPDSSSFILVLCNCPDDERAGQLADALVRSRLAACVNISAAVRSVYVWQGEMQHDGERTLLIKSRRDRYAELEQKILELHPYEVPEIIAVPLVEGHQAYLRWVEEVIR
jgi:periplasmic divalent cation tolerance protein